MTTAPAIAVNARETAARGYSPCRSALSSGQGQWSHRSEGWQDDARGSRSKLNPNLTAGDALVARKLFCLGLALAAAPPEDGRNIGIIRALERPVSNRSGGRLLHR